MHPTYHGPIRPAKSQGMPPNAKEAAKRALTDFKRGGSKKLGGLRRLAGGGRGGFGSSARTADNDQRGNCVDAAIDEEQGRALGGQGDENGNADGNPGQGNEFGLHRNDTVFAP